MGAYDCPSCGLKFKTRKEFEMHAEEKHGYKSKKQLSAHIEEKHGMPGYVDVIISKMDESGECEHCGIKYKSKDDLKDHYDEHHGMPGTGAV